MESVDVIGRYYSCTDYLFIVVSNSAKTLFARHIAPGTRPSTCTKSLTNLIGKMKRYNVPVDLNRFGRHSLCTLLLTEKKVKVAIRDYRSTIKLFVIYNTYMFVLVLFAFLGGIVTILSPCILPILPIVLSGSITGGKRRPLGVVSGFIASFTFFTLFLTAIVKTTGISPDILRTIAVVVIAAFGLGLLIPAFQQFLERMFSRMASLSPKANAGDGFLSGLVVGLSLGLVWTPCVGPILASIIALAATQTVGLNAVVITLFYALGTSLPLLAITFGGRQLLVNHPWLIKNTEHIQKLFGGLMLFTALAIFMSWDVKFQTYILNAFPNYGTGLTAVENNPFVRRELDTFNQQPATNAIGNLFDLNYGDAPEFIAGGSWLNSKPLTMKELRGKVVLVDFWTYTCINCIRTLPYLKSWWDKYKDMGLVIVGVHTPEFEFEHSTDNVAKAVKNFGITYPVMQDNFYATWNTYSNDSWPAEYLIDKSGKIRFKHSGEGDYDASEKHIQELLSVTMPIQNPTYAVDAQTPETYLGRGRGDYSKIVTTGSFLQSEEFTHPKTNATLTYRFYAKNVYLVMRPTTANLTGRVRVLLDGKLQKEVTIDTDKLYTLIELSKAGAHELKLEFLDDNVDLFAFTFG